MLAFKLGLVFGYCKVKKNNELLLDKDVTSPHSKLFMQCLMWIACFGQKQH